jgi:hypothetical protein
VGNAAIYARVSSARQKDQETIGSRTAAPHAEQLGLDVPPASTPPGPQFGLAHLVAHPGTAGSSVVRIRGSAIRPASPASATRPCLPYTSTTRDSATVDSIRTTVDPVAQRRSVLCIVLARL